MMSIESAIEKRIKEAIERGEFDDLNGSGKPIDLDAYFNTPEDLRMAYSILKSNDFVPQEVELMRQIGAIKEEIEATNDEAVRAGLKRRLHDRSLRFVSSSTNDADNCHTYQTLTARANDTIPYC